MQAPAGVRGFLKVFIGILSIELERIFYKI